jgi:RNA polymerase sigma-70 factor (ECF subfamily)
LSSTEIAEVFRNEWSRLVAIIVRDFGDLELAEDVAQEAFMSAATAWDESGVPDKPGAWLVTTARRKAIDRIRRAGRYEDKLALLEAQARSASTVRSPDGLLDDQLALLLGCCHPALNREAQVALTLRAVAGLTTAEIARGFLVPEATMGKRLTRARSKIRDAGIPFVIPDRELLRDRLDQVLQVIYLIFTEGHAATSTETELVRGDLCDEALWLSGLVAELVPDDSEALALAALIRLTDARRATRVDVDGLPILLEDQDRALWDTQKIEAGLEYLFSREGGARGVGPLYFQAAVAALHATAASFADTDWGAIVTLYDQQIQLGSTAILRLNRAAAIAYRDGPVIALMEIEELKDELADYIYFHSARAEMLRRLEDYAGALDAYGTALEFDIGDSQRKFLEARRDHCAALVR